MAKQSARNRSGPHVSARDVAGEVIRRTIAKSGGNHLPYVVRLSDPPTAGKQLQLTAYRLLGQPIAIMPAKLMTVEEWVEKYAPA
jgi:hypothetical protein